MLYDFLREESNFKLTVILLSIFFLAFGGGGGYLKLSKMMKFHTKPLPFLTTFFELAYYAAFSEILLIFIRTRIHLF